MPNVYLIVLEAYQDTNSLKAIYDFDNSDTERELEKIGFTIYRNTFSNYNNTGTSMAALFTMQHHFCKIATGKDDAIGFREIIGGKSYNALLDVFKNNKYFVQYISHSDYCYLIGDGVDFAYPERSIFKVFEIYQIDSLDRILSSIFKDYRGAGGKNKDKDRISVSKEKAHEVLYDRISIAATDQVPYFTFFKHHLPGHFGKNWNKISSGRLNRHIRRVKECAQSMLELVTLILKLDPDSLIVLIGDHGAWRYRNIWRGKDDFHTTMKKRNVPEDILSHDLFGTFLAIKYPDDVEVPYGKSSAT